MSGYNKRLGREIMPTAASVMADLKKKGTDKMRRMYVRHGMAAGNAFGVSMADLKLIAKSIKGQQALACELYETGNLDAMYLAGMVADGSQMTKKQLNHWAEATTNLHMISAYSVPWVTVENPDAHDLAIQWIKSNKEHVASSGWATYSGLAAVKPDADLDLAEIERLLTAIPKEIHSAPNRVRSSMNAFVIAVGTYVKPLLKQAKASARQIGEVSVDLGDTACKVRSATASIEKIESSTRLGQKRKTIRC
jgi:3-methyladenine DNA glycosylase AlkD